MNARFETAPIYGLGANVPAEARTVALGWPIWISHVRVNITGRSSQDTLDLFETAVLDLAAAGVRGLRQLATDLDLDRELVAHVAAELGRRELLDRAGEPTELGADILARRRGEREHHVSGFVLVDAWSGHVLNGLHPTLESLEVTDYRPSGRDHWATMQVVVERTRTRVSLVPARRHPPDVGAADERSAVDDALSRGSLAVAARRSIRGLSKLGEPWPAHVLVWAYRRLAGSADEFWVIDRDVRVLDPTGGQDAIEFEAELRQLRGAPGGERAMASLYRDDEHDSRSAWEKSRQALLDRLGPMPNDDHHAIDSLAEALILRADGWTSNALVSLVASLESTLRAVASEKQYRDAQARLSSHRHVAPVLEEALSVCGFQPESPPATRNALPASGPLMLRSLAALIVLVAADDDDHPLRALAREQAEDAATDEGRPTPIAWLRELDELAYHRNVSAHGSSPGQRRVDPDPHDVDRWFQLVERTTFHLLRRP